MLANDMGDVVARFIGSFEIATESERLRQSYEDFLAARARQPSFKDGESEASKAPGLGTDAAHNPKIDLLPDSLAIEHVRLGPLPHADIAIAVPGLDLHGFHQGGSARSFDAADTGGASSFSLRFGLPREGAAPVRPDGAITIEAGPGSGLFDIGQDSTLVDDDVFTAVAGRLPGATPDALAAELQSLLDEADAWTSLPGQTNDIAAIQGLLVASAAGEGEPQAGEVPTADGFAEHSGLYVNGTAGGTAPDLALILEERFDVEDEVPPPSDGPVAAVVSLGDNVLVNQVVLVEAATFGRTTVVIGDYHETNSIRQLNILADDDVAVARSVDAFVSVSAQTYNVALFDRVDPTPDGEAPILAAFPRSYTVDVVEGDLLVSNFIRQIHKISDNDGALFTSVEHSAVLSMGGNAAVHFTSLSQLTLGYDLVIFGGSVFEGNFIEQINLLIDHDRIGGEASFESGASGTTGGNLLYNKASIVTIGAADEFGAVDPAIRDLVQRFEAGDGTVPADLSADLAYLGATDLRVLYITGDYVELNVISQMNILSDADSADYVDGLIESMTADEAVWTVSTGDNILANDATIVDADAAGPRQLGGEYYSDSVLIQADLVSDGEDIQVFDTQALANELVAFTADEGCDHADDVHHAHAGGSYEAPTEGVGTIPI